MGFSHARFPGQRKYALVPELPRYERGDQIHFDGTPEKHSTRHYYLPYHARHPYVIGRMVPA